MAESFDPILDLLPRAPLGGLNVKKIQGERKKYWDKFMERYAALSEECTDELEMEDIDDPKKLQGAAKIGVKMDYACPEAQCGLPVTRAFRQYMKDQGDMVDELTTIAGPPQIDEEDLSTDSEEDEEKEERDGDTVEEQEIEDVSANENNNLVFSPSPVKKPLVLDDNTDDENDDEDDDEDDGLFYTPPSSKIGKSGRIPFSPLISSSADVNAQRRKRLQLGHNRSRQLAANTSEMSEPSPIVSNSRGVVSNTSSSPYTCVMCGEIGDINLDVEQEFRCDTCLLERTHVDCEDVTCGVCRDVAATIEARWILRSRQEDKENIDTTSESQRKQGNTQELQNEDDSATADATVSDSEVDKTDPGEEDGDEESIEDDGECKGEDKN